jgi:hypothetical protein
VALKKSASSEEKMAIPEVHRQKVISIKQMPLAAGLVF